MKKILILTAIGLCVGFYFWPKETEHGVHKGVQTVVSTATGALKGGMASARAELKN